MKSLESYIKLASRGDASAAFEAAKIMFYEKYNEVIFQSMLRKAAKLGNINAQRYLGFIGLANKLVEPSSTTTHIIYNKSATAAYEWFEKASNAGDVISTFAVYKCLQHGIGVEKNEEKAEETLNTIVDHLSLDILPLMFFFDTYHVSKTNTNEFVQRSTLKTLLAS